MHLGASAASWISRCLVRVQGARGAFWNLCDRDCSDNSQEIYLILIFGMQRFDTALLQPMIIMNNKSNLAGSRSRIRPFTVIKVRDNNYLIVAYFTAMTILARAHYILCNLNFCLKYASIIILPKPIHDSATTGKKETCCCRPFEVVVISGCGSTSFS